jgi:hypothetical protein
MLLLDGGIWGLDPGQFEEMASYLSSPNLPFQTLIVTPGAEPDIETPMVGLGIG